MIGMKQTLWIGIMSVNKQLTQQDFDEQDITSGFIMNLIKLTQQNIRLAKQTTNNERESYEEETRRIQT